MRRPFTNLTLDERRVIARLLQAKVPKTKYSAAILGRDRSTITCEVKRNWWGDKDVLHADGCLVPAQKCRKASGGRRPKELSGHSVT